MRTDTLPPPVVGSGDDSKNTEAPKPAKANETTLLTPAQTYFADEKIQIPETDVGISIFNAIGRRLHDSSSAS